MDKVSFSCLGGRLLKGKIYLPTTFVLLCDAGGALYDDTKNSWDTSCQENVGDFSFLLMGKGPGKSSAHLVIEKN